MVSNVKVDELVELFLRLGLHYKDNVNDFPLNSKLRVFYEGKFDTLLELCMYLEFNDLLEKLEELD
jgi:hypothetical protein